MIEEEDENGKDRMAERKKITIWSRPARVNVFGGVAYLPQHEYADMHGLLRFCAWVPGIDIALAAFHAQLRRVGIRNIRSRTGFMARSQSHEEEMACIIAGRGTVMVCRLDLAYLDFSEYKLLSRMVLVRKLRRQDKRGEKHKVKKEAV